MSLSTFPVFDRPSNISVVDSCSVFSDMSIEVRGKLASHSFMAFAETDETIWTSGSPSDFIGIVGSGSVGLSRPNKNGFEVELNRVETGQCFGMEAICGRTAYVSNAIAREHTWYLKIPVQVLVSVLSDRPSNFLT